MRIPTYWFCFISIFGAIMLLPTPAFNGLKGFVILAAWYTAFQPPSWMFVVHTVVATVVACLWTRILSQNDNHNSDRQRGMLWMFVYTTFCAIALALLRFAGTSAYTMATLMIPIVVYFVEPWFTHTGVKNSPDG